jgi:hypothetical protein
MKLSARYLANQLNHFYQVSMPRNVSQDPCLLRPSLILPGVPPDNYVAYVCKEEELSQLPLWDASFSESLMIVLQDEKSNIKYQSPNIVTILGVDNPIDVFLKMQDIFRRNRNWYEDIINSYLKDKSIQKLLEISVPVFKNTLFVVGMDFTVVARANSTSIPGYEKIQGSTEETAPVVQNLKNSELYSQVRELDGAFLFPRHVTGLGSMAVNIKKNGKSTHRLVMLEDARLISEDEGFLVEFLASLIENLLNNMMDTSISHNRILYNVLLGAITDRAADHISVSQDLSAEGWLTHHTYQCVLVELSALDRQNELHKPLMGYIANTFGVNCALRHLENILVFVNLTLSNMTSEELISVVHAFSKNNNIQTGISRAVMGHMELRRQYIQALNALRIGRHKDRTSLVHQFDDVTMDYILQQAMRSLPGDMICHSKLLLLEESDLTKDTEYLDTLQLYLENQCNASQTASSLNIHRSTMLYRLGKIQEILQSDLRDPEEILHLMLSFRLVDFTGRREQYKRK